MLRCGSSNVCALLRGREIDEDVVDDTAGALEDDTWGMFCAVFFIIVITLLYFLGGIIAILYHAFF